MKSSWLWLFQNVLQDCGAWCDAATDRDFLTISIRTEHEGDSFLTITLPTFCQGFERSLAEGRISPSYFPSFSFGKAGLPKFLSGFLGLVFGRDGTLLHDVNSHAVYAVRQICLLAKKVCLPCNGERLRSAEESYLATDQDCGIRGPRYSRSKGDSRDLRSRQLRRLFRSVAGVVVSGILQKDPFGLPSEGFRPHHGPGVTSDRLLGNAKWHFHTWSSRAEKHFPRAEYARGSMFGTVSDLWIQDDASTRSVEPDHPRMEGDHGIPITVLSPEDEQPVKVCFVPKTLKTPRVIAVEPTANQYLQQGIADFLVSRIESAKLTAGHVNFADQSVNQNIAKSSSIDCRFATLDMKDASDRVAQWHVRDLFSVCPDLLARIFATRTRYAKLPLSGEVIRLRKFASMGSALCFPVESLAFFVALLASRLHIASTVASPRNIENVARTTYVYGDDLIVPSDEASAVIDCLELLDFKVNRHKSFWTGKFRESCGGDWYNGYNVKPTYVRHAFPSDRSSVTEIVSWVSTANQFYMAGMWNTSMAIRDRFEKRLRLSLPSVSTNSPALGWHSVIATDPVHRWNKDLHRFEFKALVPSPLRFSDPLDGDPALLKCFLTPGVSRYAKDHLERSTRRYDLALKRRWVPALP